MASHPMQDIELDGHGVPRFRANAIVQWLLDAGPFDLNDIARRGFSDNDNEQMAQLIGYSVSGFGDLGYTSDEAVATADAYAEGLING